MESKTGGAPQYTLASNEHAIPARDPLANKRLLDLTNYYNAALTDNLHHKPGNTLSDLPSGIREFGKIMFDVRGVIQLAGKRSEEITTLLYPESIREIPVSLKGSAIHFLHASAWNIDAEKIEIGGYFIHYSDGQSVSLPLVYRENIWDWWGNSSETDQVSAWRGRNERTTSVGQHIRLFQLSWANPFPEKEIQSIGLVSNCKGPGPMVVAISVSE
ncbi:MAG: hypothetical protein AB9834_07400 [Lentimicrobium sp.]